MNNLEHVIRKSLVVGGLYFVPVWAMAAPIEVANPKDFIEKASNLQINQTKTVTGTVVDAAGIPVIGANILVKGTTNGTITDIDGNFSIEVEENSILEVSYIGYVTTEVKVGVNTTREFQSYQVKMWQYLASWQDRVNHRKNLSRIL